jgi:hypothetical protein
MIMIRACFTILGLGGVALLFYDAIYFPWSQYSLFSERLFGNSVGNGSMILLVLLFFRLSVLLFLVTAFCQAVRWQYYLGATEVRPIWNDDLNPDAY